jgi:hypothetical protein
VGGEFNHECCTLPCGGASLNRNFRFFLPDPDSNPDKPYTGFSADGVVFTVEAEPNKPVDLSAQVAKILVANQDQLSGARFQSTVKGWMTAINKLIASTPELAQDGKAQWLTLAYKPMTPGRLGVLSIEYFQCLKFDIRITSAWAHPQDKQTMAFTYSPDGTTINLSDTEVAVPAYDGTSIDKCSDAPKPVNLCPVPPEFGIQIQGPGSVTVGTFAGFAVNVTPPQRVMNYVWEAQDGSPAMGNGPRLDTSFRTGGAKLVSVTAFNASGCSVTSTITVKVEDGSTNGPILTHRVATDTPVATKTPSARKTATVKTATVKTAVAKNAVATKTVAKKAGAKAASTRRGGTRRGGR